MTFTLERIKRSEESTLIMPWTIVLINFSTEMALTYTSSTLSIRTMENNLLEINPVSVKELTVRDSANG
jgi:hypothetical protein